jgi:EF-P beta-lysylation protein EpmB
MEDWKNQLTRSISTVEDLSERLDLSDRASKSLVRAAARFPIKISPYYFDLIDPDNIKDPIRRQVVPTPSELWRMPGEKPDPLKEKDYSPLTGLIHKYRNRVLITATSECAVHCRFCFRKHTKNLIKGYLSSDDLEKIYNYIERRRSIHEAILSGGDPLILSDDQINQILSRLALIKNISVIRIHTRIPAVLPSRITDSLASILSNYKPCWLVAHFNHPTEMTQAASESLNRLSRAGVALLNQTVLLHGVNDSVKTLTDLSYELIRCRVAPYYLHLLDPVPGASHFRISNQDALHLLHELQIRLPGYAVPRLVQEIAGDLSKRIIQ